MSDQRVTEENDFYYRRNPSYSSSAPDPLAEFGLSSKPGVIQERLDPVLLAKLWIRRRCDVPAQIANAVIHAKPASGFRIKGKQVVIPGRRGAANVAD